MAVKVRENNQIINKSLYIAIGVNIDSHKEVLGLWFAKNEGANFWFSVITELKKGTGKKLSLSRLSQKALER